MVESHTILIQKDVTKRSAAGNYRPIVCFNLLCKLLVGIIAHKVYNCLDEQHLLPEERKGCKQKSRGTKAKHLIEKATLRYQEERIHI